MSTDDPIPTPDAAPRTPTDTRAASLSPSLHGHGANRAVPAYEIKFLLTEEGAREAEQRLHSALLPDPHSDPALGGMYAIRSLICDNAAFGVFFRDESLRNRKYRVRQYGGSDTVYLERKRSNSGRVRKRRVEASPADLIHVGAGNAIDAAHAWFVSGLRAHDLAPVCLVRYLRRALFGVCPDGPVRVTFDRSIRASLAPAWSLESQGEERPLLDGAVVCEFKFHNAMPAPLKSVIAAMKLEAVGVSKYRTCVRAFAHELGIDLSRAAVHPQGGTGVNRA